MRRLALTVGIVTLAATIAAGSAAAAGDSRAQTVPTWLRAAERQTLDAVFGGATPIRTAHISYPTKVAAIFEFSRVVICGACSAPSNALLPRGRVIRVGYDRQTHRIAGGYRFCESRHSSPPRALCLRR